MPALVLAKALAERGRADVHIEVVLGDINADEGAVHEEAPGGERTTSAADDFPVPAGECGVRSGDYSN